MFKKKEYTYQYYGTEQINGEDKPFSDCFKITMEYKEAYDLIQSRHPNGHIQIFTQHKG